MEFAPWPFFSDDEIQAAVNVLKSGKINQWTGNEVMAFEEEFARYVGTTHAIALANGSLALDLALAALDIGKDDEVIVTPRSFVASVSCVALRGAVPVFADVDPVSQNITPETIAVARTEKTKAVIAVNLAGWPCDLKQIRSFCDTHRIFLIEDCAQAHGAKIEGRVAGSFGDCAIFSFCQDKIMTTGGEGGMLVTNNTDIWKKVWSYKDHGKDYDKAFCHKYNPGFKWLVNSFGTNCRMTEMQAAMGRVMLAKLDGWVKKRRCHADLLTRGFEKIPGLRVTVPSPGVYHSYYKYYVFIQPDRLKENWSRQTILKTLNEKHIPCNTGICPEIYLENAFDNYFFKIAGVQNIESMDPNKDRRQFRLPQAKRLGETSMAFPVHPTLEEKHLSYVIEWVEKIMETACEKDH